MYIYNKKKKVSINEIRKKKKKNLLNGPNDAFSVVWAVFVLLGSVGSSDGGGGGKSVSG